MKDYDGTSLPWNNSEFRILQRGLDREGAY